MKHTPGPWRVYQGWVHPCFDHKSPQGTNGDTAICEPLGPDKQANANLIAASPEMYEVLKDCMILFALGFNAASAKKGATIEERRAKAREIEHRAMAVIAKAEGVNY